jgi:hypothetical protein
MTLLVVTILMKAILCDLFVFGIARLTRGDQDELARKEITGSYARASACSML